MHPSAVGLIVNRAPKGELNQGIKEEIEIQGLHLLGVVPQDDTVYEYDCEGRPTAGLPKDNPVKMAAYAIFDKLNLYATALAAEKRQGVFMRMGIFFL